MIEQINIIYFTRVVDTGSSYIQPSPIKDERERRKTGRKLCHVTVNFILSFTHSIPHFGQPPCIHCTLQDPHSKHRFPTPSSRLCQNWLRHRRGTLYLRAAVHRRSQRPPKGWDTNKTVEATKRPSTHVNMRRVRSG